VIGLALILSAVVTSLLVASSLRLPSLVSTLLAAYLAFVANLGLVTLALSPFREVTRGGLAVAEAVLLAAAIFTCVRRGRPGLPLAAARGAIGTIVSDPLTLLYLVVVVAALVYELVLGLTVPPNNWDSLTYHLSRVVAWAQHDGIYWIPNAPTDRMNDFQPLAEQQILFFFVATHRDLLYAIPQFLAELAILTGVYGASRRLGFEVRSAACSAFLLATFGLLALEATTAQNDLVAAAFPIAAACLLLGGVGTEPVLAGVAAGLGVGAKLTTALVWPVLIWLSLTRGRRTFFLAVTGAVVGFAAIGGWGFVLNAIHSGTLLGNGTGRTEHTVSPSFPGSLITALSILYETMDLSVLWREPIHLLAGVGVIAAVLAGGSALRRTGVRRALTDGASVAVPFLAPGLVIVGGAVLALATRRLGTPVRGSGGTYGELNNTAS
jgi:Glycosyltransferase family 87